ncbi:unnamed protein product, partial [Staurois parvus]
SFQVHIQSLSKPCHLNLRNISRIHPFLTNDTTQLLNHSLSIMNTATRLIHLTNCSVSATPLCQSLHWLPISVLHPSLPILPLAFTQCLLPLSANPSTGLHSMSSTPLCQSLHWPPLSVLHSSLPIPPLASTQCPPPLSANPSTGLHSVSSTPLCQS